MAIPNIQDQLFNNQLTDSAWVGNLFLAIQMLKRGADIHTQNDLALRLAAEAGHLQMVKMLLEHGADLQSGNNSALRFAINNNHHSIVLELLAQGADIEIGLDTAKESGKIDTLDLLERVKLSRKEQDLLKQITPETSASPKPHNRL